MVVKAQEVEAIPALGEAGDLGLVGVQMQPDDGQDLSRPSPGLLGPSLGGADDDEVVAVPDERPQAVPGALPFLVQHMEGDIGEQRGDR